MNIINDTVDWRQSGLVNICILDVFKAMYQNVPCNRMDRSHILWSICSSPGENVFGKFSDNLVTWFAPKYFRLTKPAFSGVLATVPWVQRGNRSERFCQTSKNLQPGKKVGTCLRSHSLGRAATRSAQGTRRGHSLWCCVHVLHPRDWQFFTDDIWQVGNQSFPLGFNWFRVKPEHFDLGHLVTVHFLRLWFKCCPLGTYFETWSL